MYGPNWDSDRKKPSIKGYSWNSKGNLNTDWILNDIKELTLIFNLMLPFFESSYFQCTHEMFTQI